MLLLRLIPIVLLTVLLPDFYIDRRYLRPRSVSRIWRLLHWLPATILLLGFAALCLAPFAPARMEPTLWWFTIYMVVALPKTAFALLDLIGRLPTLVWPAIRPFATGVSLVAALGLCGAMVYGFAIGPRKLKVVHTDFVHPDVPAAFDGYRIVQFTDLHLVSMRHHPEVVTRLVDSINAQAPDLIAFTGDMVSIDADEIGGFEAELARLRATDGVFSVLGNHDYALYASELDERGKAAARSLLMQKQHEAGWTLLLNEHRLLHRGTDSIALVGVENHGKPPFPQRADLGKALRGLPTAGNMAQTPIFKVLLSHDPSHWRTHVLPQTDIRLTLSGHTHGMQLRIGSWSPSRYLYPEWGGLYLNDEGRGLHVSLGVGGALLPFRFGAWPEINVITLRRAR